MLLELFECTLDDGEGAVRELVVRLVGVSFFHEDEVLLFDDCFVYRSSLDPKNQETFLLEGNVGALPHLDDVTHVCEGLIRGHGFMREGDGSAPDRALIASVPCSFANSLIERTCLRGSRSERRANLTFSERAR